MVFVWMIKFEEDFIEESFYVICKISESIIWESFEEFELEFMGDLRMLEFNIGENWIVDWIIIIKKCLNIEEERVNNSGDILNCEVLIEKNKVIFVI